MDCRCLHLKKVCIRGHFNESLAQQSTSSMDGIRTRAVCYIKGKERNADKQLSIGEDKLLRRRLINHGKEIISQSTNQMDQVRSHSHWGNVANSNRFVTGEGIETFSMMEECTECRENKEV
ncbi:hypothetical protein SESBI_37334 [Sesbania bispinosa]|nr:hypothetical protein SESBI_37334 [Sesbania bispinosa]